MSVLDQFSLEGTVGLVTGAARGIGRAYAEGLVEAGARVACLDVDEENLQRTVEELGGEALARNVDVTDPEAVEEAVRTVDEEFGRIDHFYANAGIGRTLMPFYERSLEDWRDVVELNLTGVFITARTAARYLIDHEIPGNIISTASIHGFVGTPEGVSPDYTASKSGVVGLTKEMAISLAPHDIRANAIAPSYVDTRLLRENLEELGEEGEQQFYDFIESQTLLGLIEDPGELKGTAVFLASEASSFVTGVTLPVDSGYLSR